MTVAAITDAPLMVVCKLIGTDLFGTNIWQITWRHDRPTGRVVHGKCEGCSSGYWVSCLLPTKAVIEDALRGCPACYVRADLAAKLSARLAAILDWGIVQEQSPSPGGDL
jgi:hypothetical protein